MKFRFWIIGFWACLIWGSQFLQAFEDDLPKTQVIKKALIFGVAGQDGSYLTELLLEKNYEVHGVARCPLIHNYGPHFSLHIGDVTDSDSIKQIIQEILPDEIYNLSAQSDVRKSYDIPLQTSEVNALGSLRILESIRILGLRDKIKFYQASSSELFGLSMQVPQTETTPFHPRSPYGVSKLCAYWATVNYREAFGLFACNGILFNHESPRRGDAFVTRKITLAACRYKLGLQDVLYLGNLDARRDWGFARDYVEAMWLMLQQDLPDDYVIATGETHSVREFVEVAFKQLNIDIEWQGHGVDELGIDKETKSVVIRIDPRFYRPIECGLLVGDASKAQKNLGWKAKTTFQELVKIMVEADIKKLGLEL